MRRASAVKAFNKSVKKASKAELLAAAAPAAEDGVHPSPEEAQAKRDALAFEWNERRTVAYIVFYFLSVWAIAFLICFLMTQFLLRVSS